MKVTIDEAVCKKHGLSFQEALLSIVVVNDNDYTQTVKGLLDKEVIIQREGRFFFTQRWKDAMEEIICDSQETMSEDRLSNLAQKMRECFPPGKQQKVGSPYYYRCNNKEVISKLKKFFLLYGNYSDEEILDATKRYVASFKGNYSGMRLIKYFIMKDIPKEGEDGRRHIEQVSELSTYLENKDPDYTDLDDDWTANTRN